MKLALTALIVSLPLAVVAGEYINPASTVLPPSEWKGSNGVKQPTGFEVLGCPYYTLEFGRVKATCQDPWVGKDYNKNGGVGGSTE